MTHEPSTFECRVLIDCKIRIESMMTDLAVLKKTEDLQQVLRNVYKELDDRPDDKRFEVVRNI